MYGENSDALRAELSSLLRQHRIQHRIGGAGIHTVPVTTTDAERAEIGRLIQQYRYGVLTWCRQVLTAASPSTYLDRAARSGSADAVLLRSLTRTMDDSTATLPSLADLTTPHEFALVEGWRGAARAAALGEHDFPGEVVRGRLDLTQGLTVTKDVAEVLRALIVLDRRYKNIPNWEPLSRRVSLMNAAQACAFVDVADYSVDQRGARPPAGILDTRPRPGIAGVIQCEHHLLTHLGRVPTALNFRRLLDSQRELSHLLAARTPATAPDLARRWAVREQTYASVQRATRDLDGRLGAGGAAVAEAATAISRLRRIPSDAPLPQRALRDLGSLFDRVDQRLGDVFERGAHERLYFTRSTVPLKVDNDRKLLAHVGEHFVPITPALQADVTHLLRSALPLPRQTPGSPWDRHASRQALDEAIAHRPASRQQLPAQQLEL